ncbi:MAG: hypothetical protein CMI31_00915 [Opitutae bacterium]|nr:hypothetical protein [Opitutae bacterium]
MAVAATLFSILFSRDAFAQDDAKEPRLSFTFKALAFARVPGLDEVFHGEDEEKAGLRLPTRNFSPAAKYEGTNPVTFFNRKTNDEGELEYFPVAAVTVKKEWKNALLIFFPTSRQVATTTGRRFQVLAVDGELASFRGGGRHFVNVSGKDVAATIGEQKLLIQSGGSVTFAPRIIADVIERVPVQIHFRQDDQWRLLSSTRWSLDARQRTLIFIFEDPRRKRLALRGVSERLP